MTECKQIQDLLPAFLEGILSSDEKRLVDEHLATCQQCSAALVEQKRITLLVQTLDEVEPPPWFAQKVMSKVREEAAGSPLTAHHSPITRIISRLFYPLHVKVPIEALASVLIVVLAFYVYRSVEPEIKVVQSPSEVANPSITLPGTEAWKKPGQPGASTLTAENKPALGRWRDKTADRITETPGTGTPKKLAPQEAPPLGSPTGEPSKTETRESAADRMKQEIREAASSPRQKEALQEQKVPLPAPGASEARGTVSSGAQGGMKEALDSSGGQSTGQVKTFAAKKAEPIGFTLRVNDVTTAVGEARQFLGQLGARSMSAESRDGTAVVTAQLAVEKIEELLKKLSTLGQVEEKGSRPATAEGFISIRIEVTGKP